MSSNNQTCNNNKDKFTTSCTKGSSDCSDYNCSSGAPWCVGGNCQCIVITGPPV